MNNLLRTLRYRTDWYAVRGTQIGIAVAIYLAYRFAWNEAYNLMFKIDPFGLPADNPTFRRVVECIIGIPTVLYLIIWLPGRLRAIGWIFTPRAVPEPDPELVDNVPKPLGRFGKILKVLMFWKEQPHIKHVITHWQRDKLPYTANSIAFSVLAVMVQLSVLVLVLTLKVLIFGGGFFYLNSDSLQASVIFDKIVDILNQIIVNPPTVAWITSTFMDVVKNQFEKIEHAKTYFFVLLFGWLYYQASCVNIQLMYELDRIYEIKDENKRSALQTYLVSFLMTALQLLVLIFLIATLGWLWPWASHLVALHWLHDDTVPVWMNICGRLFLCTVTVATLYWILFNFGPAERREHKYVQWGSWVGTGGFVALTVATFTVVPKLFHYDVLGQALGLTLLIFWLKNSCLILLIAAEVNKFLDMKGRLKENAPERRRLLAWFKRRAEHPEEAPELYVPPVDLTEASQPQEDLEPGDPPKPKASK